MRYTNTLITVAPDCPLEKSEVPVSNRKKKPIHIIQYKLLSEQAYNYDHQSLIFETFLIKEALNSANEEKKAEIWEQLFSKEHPCLRASALCKRYGFGAHYNNEGKIALYPMESKNYQDFLKDESTRKLAAMKSKR